MNKPETIPAEVSETFVQLGNYFRRYVNEPKRVYYPACGRDATPAVTFLRSEVVFLDIDQVGLDEIKKLLPNAATVCCRAEDYAPTWPFDLVIDSHSHAPFAAEVKDLKSGGYLIITNKTSDRAFDSADYELVGVFHIDNHVSGKEVTYTFVTDDLRKYEEVDAGSEKNPFSNRRKIKGAYYVFRKT